MTPNSGFLKEVASSPRAEGLTGLLQARALGGEEVCLPVEGVNQDLQAGWKEQMGDKTGKMSCDHITQSLELQAKEFGLLLWATGSP